MTNASGSTERIEPDDDPTLAALVPKRSRRRSAVLAAIGVLVVVGVFASHGVLRPTVVSDSGGGTWAALPRQRQVVTVVSLDPSGWPKSFRSVLDVPGAHVAGAWLFDHASLETARADQRTDDMTSLRAAFPDLDFGDRNRLPQPVPLDRPGELVVLWDITDCAALDATDAPHAELRTWVGTTTRPAFDEFAAPGFVMETLLETGICP